ncbi:hypothetical protein C8Q77DRAFT_351517 [Trametes polyzona]|nr:hypothetical protein C8Q77DRAFT_351517 [Trametes polyzona]
MCVSHSSARSRRPGVQGPRRHLSRARPVHVPSMAASRRQLAHTLSVRPRQTNGPYGVSGSTACLRRLDGASRSHVVRLPRQEETRRTPDNVPKCLMPNPDIFGVFEGPMPGTIRTNGPRAGPRPGAIVRTNLARRPPCLIHLRTNLHRGHESGSWKHRRPVLRPPCLIHTRTILSRSPKCLMQSGLLWALMRPDLSDGQVNIFGIWIRHLGTLSGVLDACGGERLERRRESEQDTPQRQGLGTRDRDRPLSRVRTHFAWPVAALE